MLLTSKKLRALMALGLLATAPAAYGQTKQRGIAVGIERIQIVDEDDPLSNDEPYLIVTRFEMKVQLVRGSASIVPGTLKVKNIMSGHGNLHAGDNWADEGNTYRFKPHFAQNLFRWDEPLWVVGMVVTHMEEDGFSADTARLLGQKIEEKVAEAIGKTRLSAGTTESMARSASGSRPP